MNLMTQMPSKPLIDWNRFQWGSLKTRITLGTLAIFVLSIWAITLYASRMLHEDLERALGEQQLATVSMVAGDINDDVQDRLDALEIVAATLASSLPDGAAVTQKALESLPVFQRLFNAGTFVTGLDGTAIASVPVPVGRVGVNFMDRDDVAMALKAGRPSVSKPVLGKMRHRPVVCMAAPIRDAQGRVIGAVMGGTDLCQANFLDKVSRASLGNAGTLSLIAPQHRMTVTSSDKRLVLFALPAPGVNPYLDRNIAGFEGYTLLTNVLGEQQLASVKQIPAAQWYLFYGQSSAAAFAPAHAIQQRVLLAALLLTLLAGGLTWWMLKRQLAPMQLAAKLLASRAAGGSALAPLPIDRPDEVGQLIGSLNEYLVRQDLQQRRADALLSLPDAAQSMDEPAFMQHGLDQAEQLTGSQIGFIHFVNDDQESIELVTWSRATLLHYCHASVDKHYPISQAGVWADAFRQRAPVLVNDYASFADKKGLPDGHARLDRLISVPVIDGGLIRMMVGVGNKSEAYTDTDVETVRLIADQIWRLVHQHRVEDKLRAGEWFKQSILNSVAAEVAVLSRDGVIQAVNEPWRRFALENGLEPHTAAPGTQVGTNYLAVCESAIGADSAKARQACEGIRAVLAGLQPSFSLEYPCDSPSQQRWFSMSVTPLEAGQNSGAVVVHNDITEKKRQQAKISLSAQVFNQSLEGMTLTDLQGNILMVNPAFTQITGYSAQEAVGQNPRILKSGRQDADFYRGMWEQILSTGHWAGEIWNRNKSGSIYPEWLTISTLRDEQGLATQYMASFSDLSSSKAAEHRIQWLSHFDALTGLPNLALLQDRATLALSMVQRATEPLTLMMVAIDHFGSINETMGHQVGDAVLVEMARRLSDSVREQDTVARLGGKDFMLVLPGTTPTGAAHLASELLAKLAEPCLTEGHAFRLTASIGIASFPENGANFDALFKAVEIAMHRAQARGSNNYKFYSSELFHQVMARETMLNALRQAIALEQLALAYQPQIDLQSGKICGLEALLRWQHPELGAVSPAQFIPLAEEAGLIIGIGEWVLRQACHDVRSWLDKGIVVPHVAVNVSPLQFRDNDLVAQVSAALTESRLAPGMLYVEVTESALMDDVPRNEAMLNALKTLGVKLSLDDFGTGYSSLSYLKRFPFDQVKIDQSFVRDVAHDASDSMLVRVIVSMAHGLGMKVIAEGVETEAQCEIIRTSICDEFQGYFFSKPIPAQAIEALFAEGRELPAHLLRLQES